MSRDKERRDEVAVPYLTFRADSYADYSSTNVAFPVILKRQKILNLYEE
jgi:hypothetical protein